MKKHSDGMSGEMEIEEEVWRFRGFQELGLEEEQVDYTIDLTEGIPIFSSGSNLIHRKGVGQRLAF
jgi:hypothetical protein